MSTFVGGDKLLNVGNVKAQRSPGAQTDAAKLPGAYQSAYRNLRHAQNPRYFRDAYQRS
jgi:hypothetical protein